MLVINSNIYTGLRTVYELTGYYTCLQIHSSIHSTLIFFVITYLYNIVKQLGHK